MALALVEGWTGNIDYRLKADGLTVDLTGATVELTARDNVGAVVTMTGVTTIPDELTGHVRFAPATGDLVSSKSVYSIRFKVTSGGKVTYFPNGEPEKWNVAKP